MPFRELAQPTRVCRIARSHFGFCKSERHAPEGVSAMLPRDYDPDEVVLPGTDCAAHACKHTSGRVGGWKVSASLLGESGRNPAWKPDFWPGGSIPLGFRTVTKFGIIVHIILLTIGRVRFLLFHGHRPSWAESREDRQINPTLDLLVVFCPPGPTAGPTSLAHKRYSESAPGTK